MPVIITRAAKLQHISLLGVMTYVSRPFWRTDQFYAVFSEERCPSCFAGFDLNVWVIWRIYHSILTRHSNRCNVKLIRYQFWCTRCTFRLIKSLQWYSGRTWLEIKKNVKTAREPKNRILCHEIEPNLSNDRAMHERDNPSFWDEFMNLLFSGQNYAYLYFKASTKVLSYSAEETLGDYMWIGWLRSFLFRIRMNTEWYIVTWCNMLKCCKLNNYILTSVEFLHQNESMDSVC
jgi:hypothetical protein